MSLALRDEKARLRDLPRVGRTPAGAAERLGAEVRPSIRNDATQ